MSLYRFVSQEINGDQLGELTDLQNRGYTVALNQPGEAHATINTQATTADPTLLQAGSTELVIYRNDEPIETVWNLGSASVESTETDTQLALSWTGALNYLASGLVYSGYSDTDTQSNTAWAAINTFQTRTGASYGITQGLHVGSDPSKTLKATGDTNLLEALQQFAGRADGFDFRISPDREFQTWYQSRGNDYSSDFTLRNNVQIRAYSYEMNALPGELATDARVWGANGVVKTASNTTARATYKRREASVQYSTVIDDSTSLTKAAEEIVAQRSNLAINPRITLAEDHVDGLHPDIWLGDVVRIYLDDNPLRIIDGNFRIVAIQVELDENDNETVTWELNPADEEIDS